MGTFDYFYGVNQGGMLLKHSENLSRTMQTLHMSVAECQLIASLTTKTLSKVAQKKLFHYFGKDERRLPQN